MQGQPCLRLSIPQLDVPRLQLAVSSLVEEPQRLQGAAVPKTTRNELTICFQSLDQRMFRTESIPERLERVCSACLDFKRRK